MNPTHLETLRELESYYSEGLKGVRVLLALESRQAKENFHAPLHHGATIGTPTAAHGSVEAKEFAALIKRDAVLRVLEETNTTEFNRAEMFQELRNRGHGVLNVGALVSMLSQSKEFKSTGNGNWKRVAPNFGSDDRQRSNGASAPATTSSGSSNG